MGNVYVAWLYSTATERMALEVLPRLWRDEGIKEVPLDFLGDRWCVAHVTTPSFASIRIRAVLAKMGLTCALSARKVRQEVTQMLHGALPLGSRRER
jgi:hypothetical protein